MSKRLVARCDACDKELGDYGWLDLEIEQVGPYGEARQDTHQFCDYQCLSQWSSKK